jgi:hypothetical protein
MAQGALTKFGFHTANPVTSAFEATSFSGGSSKPHLEANGMRGTRSHIAERVIEGVEEVAFQIETMPSPEEFALILAFAGFAATGTTYNLTEALTAYYFTVDKVTKVPTYSGCKCNSLTISAVKNSPWRVTMDVIGAQETDGDAASFPAISLTETPPLALHHCAVTLQSSARSVVDLTIKIDHMLEAQANNAAYSELIEPTDRLVTVEMTVPYTAANADLKNQAVAGATATAVFTYGNYSCTFTFAKLQFPKGGVPVQGKSGLMLQLSGTARMSSTTRELVITLDSTP